MACVHINIIGAMKKVPKPVKNLQGPLYFSGCVNILYISICIFPILFSRDAKQTSDFNRGMSAAAERGLLDNILLHVVIRVKFLLLTGFGLIPLLSSNLSAYTSQFRPKGIPTMDWLTLFAIRMMWLLGSTLRQFHLLMFILVKLRVMHKLNAFYRFLMVSSFDYFFLIS